jgi:hypothetical protein
LPAHRPDGMVDPLTERPDPAAPFSPVDTELRVVRGVTDILARPDEHQPAPIRRPAGVEIRRSRSRPRQRPKRPPAVRSHEEERPDRMVKCLWGRKSELTPVGAIGRRLDKAAVEAEQRPRSSAVRKDRRDLGLLVGGTERTQRIGIPRVLVGDPTVAAGEPRASHRRRRYGDRPQREKRKARAAQAKTRHAATISPPLLAPASVEARDAISRRTTEAHSATRFASGARRPPRVDMPI